MLRTIAFLLAAGSAFALEPAEVVVLVNKNVAASKQVADHYVKARGVPAGNVVALDLPKDEDISRKDYNEKLVAPLRAALKDRMSEVKCLLCVYGVPLRVGESTPSDA